MMELILGWLKALHVIGLLVWVAGLIYVTGLLYAHEGETEQRRFVRLRRGGRFNYTVFTSPGAFVAVGAGTALLLLADVLYGWMFLKLAFVGLLISGHIYLGFVMERLDTPAAEPPKLALGLAGALIGVAVTAILLLVLGKPYVPTEWIPDWLMEPGVSRGPRPS